MIIPSIQDQQSAITSSGQTVTLNEDGTWDYVDQPTATPQKTFRNTCWGMTRKRVKRSETNELFHEEDHYLLYRGKSLNWTAALFTAWWRIDWSGLVM
jgi:hypothetical protein